MEREKDTIICDLDGTIALDHGRAKKYLHQEGCTGPGCKCKRDWDGYFGACADDEPNWAVIDLLRLFFEDGYNIRLLSGRSASIQGATEAWLRQHAVPYHTLILRPIDDRTDDHILKIVLAFTQGWHPENVLFILEDRQRVVNSWRDAGYTCFQVAPGNF